MYGLVSSQEVAAKTPFFYLSCQHLGQKTFIFTFSCQQIAQNQDFFEKGASSWQEKGKKNTLCQLMLAREAREEFFSLSAPGWK